MKEIKWIKGNEVKPYRPYDYPEGYSTYIAPCISDTSSYKALGEWEEVKKKIPKELHRRRWILGCVSFISDERGEEKGWIDIDLVEGDFLPLRTHNWIMNNDSLVKRTIRTQLNQ